MHYIIIEISKYEKLDSSYVNYLRDICRCLNIIDDRIIYEIDTSYYENATHIYRKIEGRGVIFIREVLK